MGWNGEGRDWFFGGVLPLRLWLPQITQSPQPSFPRKRESRIVLPKTGILPSRHFWIPAYAGMTVGGGKDGLRGRGKDGYQDKDSDRLYAGFPLTREGRWGGGEGR